ncbi:YheC/YheD family protein [Natranaerofaba carboxydovora]|uniref:YheC/YheD family endospore coat-associated protein n=1 Tax=Natranaerofaba carboxydovora TaxID=2742683 RepID=UPI001F145A2E|nr:YheC/YheD family protein [Natranaerofaba carboxydovora]UMZ72748.1 Endospore coat-associated protein YheD [Natranaerofaba carboxydovora]
MKKTSIPVIINTFNNSSISITAPKKIKKLLDNNNPKVLKVSTQKTKVTCYENNTENVIGIPNKIAKQMGLSNRIQTNLMVKNNKLSIGPVIGVFVSNGRVRKAKKQHPHFRILEMAKANKESNAVLYFFSIKDMDFSGKKIRGTYYNEETNRFEEKIFPYPDILYDRGGGTLKSQKKLSQDIRKELEENSNLQKINSSYFFDKWDVFKNLSQYTKMSSYLPKTTLYNNHQDLQTMLQSHNCIFIKNCTSNNSTGVARVTKLSSNNYELSYFKEEILTKNFSSVDDLQNEINKMFEGSRIIIQTAINVLQVNDYCNVDMRAEVQRNGKNELELGPIFARIGETNSPVTSTRAGGSVYPLDSFLIDHFSYSKTRVDKTIENIETFLLTTFKYIEDIYGPFGEIGIDFALDKDLNIWFIECNAKPGKDTLYLASDDESVYRSFSNPLKYGKFLWETNDN